MIRRGIRLAAACTVIAVAAGCGVPTGPESFEAIDGADVPNRLNETTTTTTTTTPPSTTSTTTTPPPDQPETTTTTQPEIPTEIVDVFYLSRGQLRAEPSEVLAPVTPNDLILLLEAGPSSDLLANEITLDLIESTSADNGVLTIRLDDRVFQRIPSRDQREAIAQIVLTFLTNLRGVGQAVFTIDDERQIVPVGNFQSTEDPVSLDDYATMLVDADPEGESPEPTTTTTSTVAPTTEP